MKKGPAVERFWEKVDTTSDCWKWTGCRTPSGYGQFWPSRRKMALAHRYSWQLDGGDLPVGMQIDHICHTRECVRPSHLRLTTRAQNMQNRKGAQSDSTTGVRGVRVSRVGKFEAYYRVDGKLTHIGTFTTVTEAESAASAARRQYMTHSEMDRIA